jgi:hypothetical protein
MWGLWTWGIGGSVLLAALGAAVTLWSRTRTKRLLSVGSQVEAVVLVADPKTVAMMPDGIREYRSRVKVSYPVDGTPVEQWLVLDNEEYGAGDRLTVFHDRRHPGRVRTEASPNHDFQNALGLLTGLLGAGLLFVLLVLALLRVLVGPAY